MLTGKAQIDADRWYSIKEACAALGIKSPKTLRKYTLTGQLRMSVHPATKQIRYRGKDLEDFFNREF